MTDHWSNITEPCILRQLRTDEGREMRKKGIEKFKYKGLYPRTDGISGTLTSVLKDNLVLEPIVIGSMQANAYVGLVDGVSPCLTSAMGEGGGHIPMIAEVLGISVHPLSHKFEKPAVKEISPALRATDYKCPHCVYIKIFQPNKNNMQDCKNPETQYYRLRKLTPRECFRLMGVDDADIDKIQSHRIKTTLKNGTVKEKPIPRSAQYKLAGNSIVCDVLFHIFRTMFIPDQPENQVKPQAKQLSLFD